MVWRGQLDGQRGETEDPANPTGRTHENLVKALRRFDRLACSERGDGDLERLRQGGFAGFADDIGPILREKLEALSDGCATMLAMRAVKPGFSSSDWHRKLLHLARCQLRADDRRRQGRRA